MTPQLALDTNAYRALDDGNPKLSNLIKTVPEMAYRLPFLANYITVFFLVGSRKKIYQI